MPRLRRDVMRERLGQIVDGEFAPGQMLPRKQDLAARWATSRGVARETIRALEERGVLAAEPPSPPRTAGTSWTPKSCARCSPARTRDA